VVGPRAVARAAAHFATTPRAAAACLVGALLWRYHAAVLHHLDPTRGEADRAWDHVTAAVGLVTTVVGVALAVVAVVDAVTPAPLAGLRPGDTVALALATLALGAPLWGRTWRGLQARVAAGDVDELRSTARRVYVQGVLGLSGVVAAGSAVSILFVIFRDLLEGRLGAASVRDVRVGIGLAVAAGATAAYHWAVHRGERAHPAPARRRDRGGRRRRDRGRRRGVAAHPPARHRRRRRHGARHPGGAAVTAAAGLGHGHVGDVAAGRCRSPGALSGDRCPWPVRTRQARLGRRIARIGATIEITRR